MDDFDTALAQHLPAALYHHLQAYQARHQFPHLQAALAMILQQYFDDAAPMTSIPEAVAAATQAHDQEVDQRITSLGREVVNLRQQIPQEYDRLREQLAAVRLSHSGLLHNLRERIEVIEKSLGLVDLSPPES